MFLLPISIRFCYLDHLVANRMAPSMCPDPCGTRWGSWFQAILYHISAYFRRIFGVYAVRIFFFKVSHKTDALVREKRHRTLLCYRLQLCIRWTGRKLYESGRQLWRCDWWLDAKTSTDCNSSRGQMEFHGRYAEFVAHFLRLCY